MVAQCIVKLPLTNYCKPCPYIRVYGLFVNIDYRNDDIASRNRIYVFIILFAH